jgi:FHA domain/zinc-ribbon domain
MWRKRRERARMAAGRPDASGWDGDGGRARRGWGWRRARRVDPPTPAPVPWTAAPDYAPRQTQADLVAAGALQPMNGRLGGGMPSVYCARCGEPNPEAARFCSQCGTPLVRGQGEGGAETTSVFSVSGGEAPETEFGEDSVTDAATLDALPSGTALLVVRRGPNAGSRFLLDSDLTLIGRHPDSDIFLDDVTVSRRHAEFYRQGGRFTVRDVGSLNGTYVNRERIEQAELTGGDEVQVGKFRLVFLLGPRSQAGFGSGGAQVGG